MGERVPCSECGAEALTTTIQRNDGPCQRCAKESATREEPHPRVFWINVFITFLLPLAIVGYVGYRCLAADWGWFWTVVVVAFLFPLASQGNNYLLQILVWLYKRGSGDTAKGQRNGQ